MDESILGACPHAECLIQVSGGALFINVLLLLDKIQRHLKVFTSSFSVTELGFEHKTPIEMLLKSTIHLHENTKKFHITNSYLSQPAFARIARELRVCQHLEDLHLFLLSKMLPGKLGISLANKMSLKSVDIEACGLTDSTCQGVMLGLSTCFQLNSLNLSNITLKDNLEYFVGRNSDSQFQNLHNLQFSGSHLSENDVKNLTNALKRNIFPNLQQLDLSSNFLSGYVGKLLLLEEDNNSVYSSLTHLNLSNATPGKADFGELVQAARWNRLPSLKSLDISCNKLTGIMQDFKRNSFPRLEKLNLSSIHLNKDDVKHLADALVNNSLQNLKYLNLTGNVLRGSLQELFGDQFIPSLKAVILSETASKRAGPRFSLERNTARKASAT